MADAAVLPLNFHFFTLVPWTVFSHLACDIKHLTRLYSFHCKKCFLIQHSHYRWCVIHENICKTTVSDPLLTFWIFPNHWCFDFPESGEDFSIRGNICVWLHTNYITDIEKTIVISFNNYFQKAVREPQHELTTCDMRLFWGGLFLI